MTTLAYRPEVFDVSSLSAAMNIILTPEGGSSTEDRWLSETPYLAEMIVDRCGIVGDSLVLDYGCGVGRLAKEVISKTGCRVVGVDISASMRGLAAHYVNSPRFTSCHADSLSLFPKFDAAFSVWVLQHCFDVENDIRNISDALKPGAAMLMVNSRSRVVPAANGSSVVWANDGKDIPALLDRGMTKSGEGDLDARSVPQALCDASYWAVYRK